MKIAIIEGAKGVCKRLLDALSPVSGFVVAGRARGEKQALDLLQRCEPDVVLLDCEGETDAGLEFVKRMRTAKCGAHILVLSDRPEGQGVAPYLSAGADAFFGQGWRTEHVLAQLASWMPPLPLNEPERMRTLVRARILDNDKDTIFDAITGLSADIVQTPIALTTLVRRNDLAIKSQVGVTDLDCSRANAFCAHTILSDRLLEVEDTLQDSRFRDNPLVRGPRRIRFYAGMPLVLSTGEALGALCVMDHTPRKLSPTQRRGLEVLARSAVAEIELRLRVVSLDEEVTRRRVAEIQNMHLATRDPLTGLPNRAALMDRLDQAVKAAVRDSARMGVLFFGLDRFKCVNDTLGHSAGDTLLQQIALRVVQAIRGSDTVARLGGDEFAVLLPVLASVEAAERVANAVIGAVVQPVTLRGHLVAPTCSVGLAIYPEHADTAESLLRHADLALHQAKASGGNRYAVFTEDMDIDAVERMALESDLRQGLESGQLELHYQPQICLSDGTLTGLEALARWQHPLLGLLSPDRFIPMAEDSGLIWALGLNVLDQALAQVAEWTRQGLNVPTISVNVSPLQLRATFVRELSKRLKLHGVAPGRLEVELTESALTADGPAVNGLLQGLHALGVGIAVDDFGMGYSSLALLRRLPITTLKIDRSFVEEMTTNARDKAIVGAVVTMGRSMGLRTVAEGVEMESQKEALRAIGCEDSQGFLFSRPMTAAATTEWLQACRLGRDGALQLRGHPSLAVVKDAGPLNRGLGNREAGIA